MSTARPRSNDATRARRVRGVPSIAELFTSRELDRLQRDQERIANDPRFRDLPKVHRL
jgi:hypothetical protein